MKRDIALIIFLLLLGVCGLVWKTSGATKVEVYIQGELYGEFDLKPDTIKLNTQFGENIVEIYQDGVAVTAASCVTQECVKSGKQTGAGAVIACLPNRVLIKLNGESKEVDAVAY